MGEWRDSSRGDYENEQGFEDWFKMVWNMLIAPEKTEVMIFTPGNEIVRLEEKKVEYDGKILRTVKSKEILGITVDDKLSFHEHIASKTKSAFSALTGTDEFVQGQRGCSQSVYMWLYKALVLPIMEYGTPVAVAAIEESCKEFGKVHRSAMTKTSGV